MVHGKNDFDTEKYQRGSIEYISEKLAENMFWLSYDAMGPYQGISWPLENEAKMCEYKGGINSIYEVWIKGLTEEQKKIVYKRARDRFDEQP